MKSIISFGLKLLAYSIGNLKKQIVIGCCIVDHGCSANGLES